jgi:hypothetical protein
MQTEEAIEIDGAGDASGHRRARDRDVRTHAVVGCFAMRDDDVERIGGAALEETDERAPARVAADRGAAKQLCAVRRAAQEARAQSHRDERHRSGLHEHSAIHRSRPRV